MSIPLLTHSCYMHHPSHPSWPDHSTFTWRRVQVMKFLILQFSSITCHFISLWSKYFLNILFSNTLSLYSSLNVRTKFHTHIEPQVKL
jgi:hypothetical protein